MLLGGALFAQQEEPGHPILDNFSVLEISGKVFVSVTISQGNTCSGINVLRSADSVAYDTVGHVSGVCGSASHPVTYSFTDAAPIKNKTSYYKVELGGVGYTTVISILIIDTEAYGFQIRPSPARNQVKIYFENENHEMTNFLMYSVGGHQVMSLSSSEEYFDFNVADLENGIYIFSIRNNSNEKPIVGKLAVNH